MTTPYPDSYYAEATAGTAPRRAFAGTAKADVMVIGGGYTGLSAALHLAEAGAQVILLEATRIGFAASGRNGGQIHSGYRKHQAELEKWLGVGRARALWALAEEAKALIHARVAKHKISCALTGGVILAAHSQRAAHELDTDTNYLNQHYGYAEARTLTRDETIALIGTNIYHGGRFDAGGGHLQPLSYALGLAHAAEETGATLYEDSRVLSLDANNNGVTAKLASGIVTAEQAILACDAFTPALAPELAPYLATVDSHIVATEPLPEQFRQTILKNNAAVADTRHVVDYYRLSADHRLLFAGGEYLWGAPDDVAAFVRPHMLRVFPQLRDLRITHGWGGTVGITRTRMPHFGWLKNRILFGYGYSGHGVALATLGGKVLAEAALGKSEGFDLLASVPARRFPGGQALRRPLVAAALLALKLADML
jgi:gamma-glutamylputrescine oxidase